MGEWIAEKGGVEKRRQRGEEEEASFASSSSPLCLLFSTPRLFINVVFV
jgi:hypothetical protein